MGKGIDLSRGIDIETGGTGLHADAHLFQVLGDKIELYFGADESVTMIG